MTVRIKKVVEISDWDSFVKLYTTTLKGLDLPEELCDASVDALERTLKSQIA